nr:hypothetical protein [Burkholderia gladioli]
MYRWSAATVRTAAASREKVAFALHRKPRTPIPNSLRTRAGSSCMVSIRILSSVWLRLMHSMSSRPSKAPAWSKA